MPHEFDIKEIIPYQEKVVASLYLFGRNWDNNIIVDVINILNK